jgi:hypothetical protein
MGAARFSRGSRYSPNAPSERTRCRPCSGWKAKRRQSTSDHCLSCSPSGWPISLRSSLPAGTGVRPPIRLTHASLMYSVLTRSFSAALATVGLDPWKGLYHTERPSRPALALDLIEPFRPILADSAVLMALNNGELGPGDFVFAAGGCNLKPIARRALISAYERRLDQETTHPATRFPCVASSMSRHGSSPASCSMRSRATRTTFRGEHAAAPIKR